MGPNPIWWGSLCKKSKLGHRHTQEGQHGEDSHL